MWTALAILAGMAALLAITLGLSAKRLPYGRAPVSDHIDRLLPQTQCRECGYDGCRPYADAIATGEAAINRCPPGGVRTIRALASLLNRDVVPLAADVGEERPPAVAVIDEATCIGCTICIQECPVDAIAGARKLMHTVIAPECTGCELCVEPCPVDCIEMVPAPDRQSPDLPLRAPIISAHPS